VSIIVNSGLHFVFAQMNAAGCIGGQNKDVVSLEAGIFPEVAEVFAGSWQLVSHDLREAPV
jgi:hypothetical protein